MLSAEQPASHQWVELEHIAPTMQLAAIAAEDQHFPNHYGFDWPAMQQAVRDYLDGSRLRGASTISQQTAKNLFCWRSRSLLRKGFEAWFTGLIELLWPKQRILEVYLNIAQFSPEHYGVESAAQTFFQRPAKRLNANQAAWLAAVLPNPEQRHVLLPNAKTRRHHAWIRQQMRNLGANYWAPTE